MNRSSLTPRESQVLNLMSEGDSNKIIADKLGMSEHTAKFHIANVCRKLVSTTRAGAVGAGFRAGLLV